MVRKNESTTAVTVLRHCAAVRQEYRRHYCYTERFGEVHILTKMCASHHNEIQQYVCWVRNRSESKKNIKWW